MDKIQMTPHEAADMICLCIPAKIREYATEFYDNMKKHGYVKQTPVEKAKEIIEAIKTSGWECNYYKENKKLIDEFERQMNVLIEAIEYLEDQR